MSIFRAFLSAIALLILVVVLAGVAVLHGLLALPIFIGALWLTLIAIVGGLLFGLAIWLDAGLTRLRHLRQDPMAAPHGDAPKLPGG